MLPKDLHPPQDNIVTGSFFMLYPQISLASNWDCEPRPCPAEGWLPEKYQESPAPYRIYGRKYDSSLGGKSPREHPTLASPNRGGLETPGQTNLEYRPTLTIHRPYHPHGL